MFKKLTSVVLLVMICNFGAYAKRYYADKLIAKADSALIKAVGKDVFDKYYTRDSSLFYDYYDERDRSQRGEITLGTRTTGRFVKAWVEYAICINPFDPSVFNSGRITLDNELNVIEIRTGYVPDCIRFNTACNYISKSQALEIANNVFGYNKDKEIDLSIEFNYESGKYCWQAERRYYTLTAENEKIKNTEILVINAINGTIVRRGPPRLFYRFVYYNSNVANLYQYQWNQFNMYFK